MSGERHSPELKAQRLATHLVERLVEAGYIAYFAGGWVRDYLLHHPSSDIDIATNAPIEKILALFPHTIKVGLAFGVVIVPLEGMQFEVSTFRRDLLYTNGRKPEKIEFSTPEEDAKRRDFTINGMFYDPIQHVIYDYVHGKEDLARRVIRTIGDPYERFQEDRLRMIRAVRFASRFDFRMDSETQEAIIANADTLFPAVAVERVWQEFKKMAQYRLFDRAIIDMHRLGLLSVIFPSLQKVHLNVIKERVTPFAHYPKSTSPLFYLLSLFPDASLEELLEIGELMKMSNSETNIIELFYRIRLLVQAESQERAVPTDYEWAVYYAKKEGWRAIEVIAAQQAPHQRQLFLQQHQERFDRLQSHIHRIKHKQPLVTAAHLQQRGIAPGIIMGQLLKEADRLAILYNCEEAEEVISELKKLPQWPCDLKEPPCRVH